MVLYPIQVLRLIIRGDAGFRQRLLRAGFLVMGKFPETQGALRYWMFRALRRSSPLIEYK
jgi:hypothetical protein